MTWTHDLAWQNIEQTYRSSVASQFARYAVSLDYKALPQDVVHQAKRSLLDTLGCAIGAYEAPVRPIIESLVRGLGGTEEATVFGSGLRTTAPNVTLVNSALVRFLDYNDIGGGAHNSDAISAILAVSEREKTNGRTFLTSIVISYELGARFAESVRNIKGRFEASTRDRSFAPDIFAGLNMPSALGKVMGLNEEQIANAIGATACRNLPLGILDTDKEENTMSKDLRLGWTAYMAVLTTLLARNGFTGPLRVVEGENGMNNAMFRGEINFQVLSDFYDVDHWRILEVQHKFLPMDMFCIGHQLATLAVVNEHPIKPEDVLSVRIIASHHNTEHCTFPPKKYPRNAESADHSSAWLTAMAIRDRSFTNESYNPKNFTDPIILDLIDKVTVDTDPKMPSHWLGGECRITTKDGKVYQKRFEQAHGMHGDPMTDAEIEDKVRKMATKYMSERQIKQLIDTVWNVEKLDDMGKLAKLMIFQPK